MRRRTLCNKIVRRTRFANVLGRIFYYSFLIFETKWYFVSSACRLAILLISVLRHSELRDQLN